MELAGKTMAVVGFGSIGRAVGEIAHAFGMEVIAADVTPRTLPRTLHLLGAVDEAFRRAMW